MLCLDPQRVVVILEAWRLHRNCLVQLALVPILAWHIYHHLRRCILRLRIGEPAIVLAAAGFNVIVLISYLHADAAAVLVGARVSVAELSLALLLASCLFEVQSLGGL